MANGGLYGDPNVHTTFTGDATLVQAAAAQATKAVDDAAAQIKARNAEIADDIDEFNNRPQATGTAGQQDAADPLGFKRSVGAVTSFLGKLTAVVGIAGTFYAIGQQVRETWIGFFETGTDKAKQFALTLGNDAAANLAKTNDEIAKLQSNLDAGLSSRFGALANVLAGNTKKSLEEQIAALQGVARSNAEQIRATEQRKRDEFAKSEELRQRLEAESQQKEALDRERADDEREARQREAAESQQRDALERQRELERAQLETAAKVAEAMRKAILEPLEAIRRANESFINAQNGNLITSIDRLRATLEATGGGGRFDGAETGFLE